MGFTEMAHRPGSVGSSASSAIGTGSTDDTADSTATIGRVTPPEGRMLAIAQRHRADLDDAVVAYCHQWAVSAQERAQECGTLAADAELHHHRGGS